MPGQDLGDPHSDGPHEVQVEAVGVVFFCIQQAQDLRFQEIHRHLGHGLQDQGVLGDESVRSRFARTGWESHH
ncbi:MAG: hypothetical protein JAY74_08820 [Candidatus Thiodiazotropha taylori]|nr:hypothetical protein [Candidatus Thiodiazotropha taylori]